MKYLGRIEDSKDATNKGYVDSGLSSKVPASDYNPVAKTSDMTQPVGKDANGQLWTEVPYYPVSLTITTPPSKVAYESGEYFDPSGMVVAVNYSGGTSETVPVERLTFSPSHFTTTGNQNVAVIYKESGYTLTATQEVTVQEIIIENWQDVQTAVDRGIISQIMPIGSQLEDSWRGYLASWDAVHHDSTGSFFKWHYGIPFDITFDAEEAIYYAPDGGLAAGTYHIPIGASYGTGWVSGHAIQFTLSSALDAGDQVVITGIAGNNANDPTAGRTVNVYAKGGTTVKQTATTSDGTDGASLGTISTTVTNGNICSMQRVVYGYARWSQSAYRQWLNSTAAAGAWWTPQNGWDRPTAQAATQAGFLFGCSEDFLGVLEEVEVVTALNTVEGHATATETTLDKIFLPSLGQMYISPQLDQEGDAWDYYKTLAAEAGYTGRFPTYTAIPALITRSLSNTTQAVCVFLRSANRGLAYIEWNVSPSGSVGRNSGARSAYRGCPACKIKKSA